MIAINMTYSKKDFDNPMNLFDIRTRQVRVRIQNLEGDLIMSKHPFSRAVIKQELNKSVDEYVARKLQTGTFTEDKGNL